MPYTRAWELLLGTLLALGVFPKFTTSLQRNVGALMGVGAIGFSVVVYRPTTLFPGLSALLPCLGSALIIHAGETGSSAIGRALS